MRSDTPRSDAKKWDADLGNMVVDFDFARQLERELTAAQSALASKEAEMEACRRDAERYRLLRDGNKRWDGSRSNSEYLYGEQLDAALDAAMKGGEQG